MDSKPEKEQPSSKIKLLINILIKYVLPLALGVAIVYYMMRDIDMHQLWMVLSDTNWAILAFSLLFGLLGNTIRGYRWALILKPLGYKPSVANLNFATYGGYAVNFALPRAGEIWKCGMVTKQEDIPFPKVVGTMIVDRMLDMCTVLLVVLLACIFNLSFFVDQLKQNHVFFDSLTDILTAPSFYIALIAMIVCTVLVFKFWGENKIIKKIKGGVLGMWNDVKSISKMDTKFRLLLYSIGIWCAYFLYFYITFYAFDFTANLGITAGLTAFALSSLSMIVPSNGGLGPWQAAVFASLTLYGVDKLEATAFATGVFAVQSLWVIACGLVGIAALSLRNKKK